MVLRSDTTCEPRVSPPVTFCNVHKVDGQNSKGPFGKIDTERGGDRSHSECYGQTVIKCQSPHLVVSDDADL